MTEKETILKLFKLKIADAKLATVIFKNEFLNGFYVEKNFIGIGSSENYSFICFNEIHIELRIDEYNALRLFYNNIKEERNRIQKEIERKQMEKDRIELSEMASKENVNTSRRVLTEKHKNFKF